MTPSRADDAARLRRELAGNPTDAVAWHNLASAEGDLGHPNEAEEAARRAIALGIAAPETRLVLGRALQDLGRLDEAQSQFEEAIGRRPGYAEAHRDLAQLHWMRTGHLPDALRILDRATLAMPQDAGLQLVRSIVLEFAGELAGALAAADAALRVAPRDVGLLRQAAHLCAEAGEAARAVTLCQRAAAIAPDDLRVQITTCESLLAAGRIPEAEAAAGRLCERDPLDQYAIALRTAAWRLLGDRRYQQVCDYSSIVTSQRLQAPEEWGALEAFLADLRADLESLHRFRTHPLEQSVRGGSQLPLNAPELARRTIKALFVRIEGAVNRWLAHVGRGPDPFRSRNTGACQVTEAWSIRLGSGGFHTDHVHPRGWLSGTCYVDVPPGVERSVASGSHAGWLRLGRAGVRTLPQLPPDAYVAPAPGTLVMFPAHLWHGVEPFQSEMPRLSVAFDALPASE